MSIRKRRCELRTTPLLVAAIAVAALVGGARAQIIIEDPAGRFTPVTLPTASELRRVELDPALLRLVERMDSDSYEDREAATRQMIEDWADPLPTLAVLERRPLSAEQRHRLLEIVRTQILGKPRGALGISMQEQVARDRGGPLEVVVTDLLPGLPAEKVLRLGDRIYEVDGKPIFRSGEVLERVQNKEPGDSVELALRRLLRDEEGRPIRDEQNRMQYEEVLEEITLGSADNLINPRTGEPQRASPVVRQRERDAAAAIGRYSRSRPIPIDADLTGYSRTPMHSGPGRDGRPPTDPLERLMAELEAPMPDIAGELNTRNKWEQALLYLRKQWHRKDLTAADRNQLRKAMQRLLEMMDD